MNIFWLVRLAVAAMFGCVVAKTADNKGYYNQVAFFFYGFFAPIIALIHTLILPDTGNSLKRQYKGKTLVFNVLAVIMAFYGFLIAAYKAYDYISFRGPHLLRIPEKFTMLSDIEGVLGGVLPLLFLVSVLLGRKYKFSLFVYCVYIISSVLVMIRDIMGLSKDFSHILKLQVYGELFFQIALILGAALMGFAYYVLIRIVSKYGIKNERITYEKPVPFFILPAGLMLISVLIRIIGCVVGGYFRSEMLFSLIPIIILTVPALLFIGLFYYHDSIEEA